MAVKDGILIRRRLRIFAAAAALVLLCAVCVGGVSGAETYSHTYYVPADGSLADIVEKAVDVDRSLIIITEDYVIEEQVVLSRNYDITITNAPGVDVTIRGNADAAGSLFKIGGGTLTVMGNDDGGSLTITTNLNGRAFDVNSGSTLDIYDGVIVYQCGFGSASTESHNGGAVYVSNGGEFIMHGGLLLDNTGYKGGAVYVNNGGSFELMKGKGIITNNHALYISGGGVWAEPDSDVEWTGGDIKGNTASSKCDDNLNNIYPYIECPETEAPIRVGSGNNPIISNCEECWSVQEAYEMMKSEGVMTIFITRDFTQGYIETWNGYSYTTELDSVIIDSGITVNFKPAGAKNGDPVNLNIIDRMFEVSNKGSLVVGSLDYPSLIISGKNEVNTVDKGGFICINSATTASIINCEISDTKANKGGAIYLKSTSISLSDLSKITGCTAEDGGAVYVEGGTFRFGDSYKSGSGLIKDCTAEIGGAVYFADGTFIMQENAKITGCTAEIGGAVYFADGTFNVMNGATIDSSNDVYLSAGQVITAANGYKGTIGKITLSDYEDGRNVVDITANPGISAEKFVLNLEAHNEYGDKLLVSVDEKSKKYLELKNQIEFLITIPDALYISESSNSGSMIVTADKVRIPKDTWISVTVTSTGNFNLTHSSVDSAKLPYNLFVDDSGVRVTNNLEVAKFTVTEYLDKQTQNLKPTKSLTATVTELPPMTGTYTDTLTFTAEHIDRAFS